MALSATILYKDITADGEFEVIAQVTGDTSYPTGGYAITPALLGLNAFKTAFGGTGVPATVPFELVGHNAAASSWFPVVNYSTGKLQLYDVSATTSTSATLSELAAATNVSGFSGTIRVKGH